MYTRHDYDDELENLEKKFEEYFGEFSAEVRRKLLSKNIQKPESLYDVFYVDLRKDLLSKNEQIISTNLDEASKEIRDSLLSKQLDSILDLEDTSEQFRKSMLSRVNIHNDSERLLRESEEKRKELLSKNKNKEYYSNNIDSNSEKYRREQISKNKQEFSFFESDISSRYRNEQLSKNTEKESAIDSDSQTHKDQNVAKNVESRNNLDSISDDFRKAQQSRNDSKQKDLELSSKDLRDENVSQNTSKNIDLLSDSQTYQNDNTSKNVENESSLELDSKQYRNNQVALNTPSDTDLESDSFYTRKDVLSKNEDSSQDLYTISERYKKENVSKNSLKESDALIDSENYRNQNVALNAPKESDLERDSKQTREDDLSLNEIKENNLESYSENYKKENLSKNKESESDLENISYEYRKNNIALNTENSSNIDSDSIDYRKQNIALNTPKESDIERDSEQTRIDDLALNNQKTTDLEEDSFDYRVNNLSLNSNKESDLLSDSEELRDGDLALTVPKETDLLEDSTPTRDGDLALNVPKESDLLIDSTPLRDGDVALNVPKESDLLIDSEDFRDDNLAPNVPNQSDLLSDSEEFRDENISSNVPNESDLLTDSEPTRDGDLALNVPNNSDLLTDSEQTRNDDLALNTPNGSDLLVDSIPFRNDDLASNEPIDQTLESHVNSYGVQSSATEEKDKNVSKNEFQLDGDKTYQSNSYNLISTSQEFMENNMSKNNGNGMMGLNVITSFGTSQYVGISNVWTQGLLYRSFMVNDNNYRVSMFGSVKNEYLDDLRGTQLLDVTKNVPTLPDVQSGNYLPMTPSTDMSSLIRFLPQDYSAYSNVPSPSERNMRLAVFGTTRSLETKYAFGAHGEPGSYFPLFPLNFEDGKLKNTAKEEKQIDTTKSITLLMRDYLRYLNPFVVVNGSLSLNPTEKSSEELANTIKNLAQGNLYKSLNDLLTFYPEAFKIGLSAKSKKSLTAPGMSYIGGDVEKLMGSESSSIAQKTVPGIVTDDNEFRSGTKGVRHILNRIANDSSSKFSKNFQEIQGPVNSSANGESANPKEYVIGLKADGSERVVRQKFTVKNPYAASNAYGLVFYIKNYASNETMFFPPYIGSFQNSDNANWNATSFLGRPEPVYTYNNSTRDGSISFFVLTDYAERILIGRSQDDDMDLITLDINRNFTDEGVSNFIEETTARIKENTQKNKEIKENIVVNLPVVDIVSSRDESVYFAPSADPTASDRYYRGVTPENSELTNSENARNSINSSLNQSLGAAAAALPKAIGSLSSNRLLFSESNDFGNVYNNIDKTTSTDGGYIDSKVRDTKEKLSEMIRNLQFQPGYFSGSLGDFKRRMEFVARLTRPSANNLHPQYNGGAAYNGGGSTGFSFFKPPVCHLRLGDWFDHDIIINSVSYDYTDAPWTLGSKDVQPMWANISINFNIVGPVGVEFGLPLTSTDQNNKPQTGFFGVGKGSKKYQ